MYAASIYAQIGKTLAIRFRMHAQFWTGSGWGSVADAELTQLGEMGLPGNEYESLYHMYVASPVADGRYTAEYVDMGTSMVIGSEQLPLSPSAADIDAALTAAHGDGSWQAVNSRAVFTVPAITGQVYTAVAQQQQSVAIMQGDTPSLTFRLDADYTGWTPRFAAKFRVTDTEYAIPVIEAQWVDAAHGIGLIPLTSTDTAATGKLLGELELTNGTQVITPLRFTLSINPDIVKPQSSPV